MLVRNYGFANLKISKGAAFDERKNLLLWISSHPAILALMKKYNVYVINLRDKIAASGFWGQTSMSCHTITVRLMDNEELLRVKWDIILTVLHELAHYFLFVHDQSTFSSHRQVWKN